jgi:hypothetical protein
VSDTKIKSRVYQGKVCPRLSKTLVTFGTTPIIMIETMIVPTPAISNGYARAPVTFPRRRVWPSMKSARRSSTASSVPDASPAATMLM